MGVKKRETANADPITGRFMWFLGLGFRQSSRKDCGKGQRSVVQKPLPAGIERESRYNASKLLV